MMMADAAILLVHKCHVTKKRALFGLLKSGVPSRNGNGIDKEIGKFVIHRPNNFKN